MITTTSKLLFYLWRRFIPRPLHFMVSLIGAFSIVFYLIITARSGHLPAEALGLTRVAAHGHPIRPLSVPWTFEKTNASGAYGTITHQEITQSIFANDETAATRQKGIIQPNSIAVEGFTAASPYKVSRSNCVDLDENGTSNAPWFINLNLVSSTPLYGMTVQKDATRGLARIAHRSLRNALSHEYIYDPRNISVPTVYLVDSGVQVTHKEFAGRVLHGPVFSNDPVELQETTDRMGHGTHLMGLILGEGVGVARSALGVSVQIYNRKMLSSEQEVLKAMLWIIQQPGKNSLKVINLSLNSIGTSEEIYYGLFKYANSVGIHIIASAGNLSSDVSGQVPCTLEFVICVGAVDNFDERGWYSNYGKGVDIVAPGSFVKSSARSFCDDFYIRQDGTSMAAAYVSGTVAYMLSLYGPMKPSEVLEKLNTWATVEAIGFKTSPAPKILNNGNGVA